MRYRLLKVRYSGIFNIGYYVGIALFDLPKNDDWLIESEIMKITGSKDIKRLDISDYYREYTSIEGERYAVELIFHD